MDADAVRNALLQRNYFPHHRTKSSELPPCFTTESLDSAVAAKIVSAAPYATKYTGCDYVQYTLTRFNGGPGYAEFPIPTPTVGLWNEFTESGIELNHF
jgi:hypothetical protein